MARVRSPNYPSISLPDAIERARKVYEREHTHKAAPEVIAKALGYVSLNGTSLGVMSALKKYGLLEEVGKDWKISSDALTILVDPPTSPDRAVAIRRAAQAPQLFAALLEEYGEQPPSDENLRAYLLKKGFSLGAVDNPIRSYRETLEFVSRLPDAYNPQMNQAAARPDMNRTVQPGPATLSISGHQPSDSKPLLAVLFTGTSVQVQATLESQVGAKQLIRVIEANMPLLPEKPPSDATDQKDAE
jgi:hypothetical protein